jgi:hypothetical protein
MKAPLRTKSIGTKVSEEEFAALEATARAADMTLSEWVRAVLLAAPGVELPDDEAALAGRVALAEVLALRTLFLNLHPGGDAGRSVGGISRWSLHLLGADRPCG